MHGKGSLGAAQAQRAELGASCKGSWAGQRGRGRSGSGDGAEGRNVRQRVSPAAVPAPTVRLPKMHRTALVASTGALAQTFTDWFDADIGSGYSALKAKYHDAPWSLRKRWCKELAKDSDSD